MRVRAAVAAVAALLCCGRARAAEFEQAYAAAQGVIASPAETASPPAALPGTDHPELRAGLRLLFKNVSCRDRAFCWSPAGEDAMVSNALAFKARFDSAVGIAPPALTWKGRDPWVREFEFDSPWRRDGEHPSNKVRGFVYFPNSYGKCGLKFPATVILQKLSDEIESERQIARLGATSDRGVVMTLYLPHFGPRRGSESFISKDPQAFEENVLQALLDIHASYLALKALPGVKEDDIGLMGLSLGAMIGLVSAGVDPVFDRYGTNVGGGDLANIVTYRKSGDVDSQTGRVLKDIDWSVDQARFFISRFDAVTWSLNVRNKTIVMINADGDELIDKRLSLDPLVEGYRAAGSTVRRIEHRGTHVFRAKEVGYWDSLRKVVLPMLNFLGPNNWEAQRCGQEGGSA